MKLSRVITHRMSGDDVRWLQTRLKEIGFYLDRPDGFYGQSTLMAVFNFQNNIGIKSDGIFGPQTWSQLINYKVENPIEYKKNEDIELTTSYCDDIGFKIYDSLVSDEFFYKEESKKNTIFIKRVSNSNYTPDNRPEFWKPIFKRDEGGDPVINKNGNPEILKSACHYIIGNKIEDSVKWDGKVIRFFDDKYWSNHIDVYNNLNTMSITIELCNGGPLVKKNDKFYTLSGSLIKDDSVVKLENEFKGYQYWSKYSDNQLLSLDSLLKYLIKKWNMDTESGIYNESWFDFHKKWISTDGIRIDSQLDINNLGIFPQKEIINVLNGI